LAFVRGSKLSEGCSATAEGGRVLVVVNNDASARDVSVGVVASGALQGCAHFSSLLGGDGSVPVAAEAVRVHLAGQEIGIYLAQP